MSTENTTENNETSDQERVYNLTLELAQIKQQKKDAMGGFRDEIKRIEGEIKDILKGAGEDIGDGNDVS
jgi:hypothetical protein